MNKGVAERTIVLIILAVVVIGLVGYLIYRSFGKGRTEIMSKECLAARLNFCLVEKTDSAFADVQKSCGELAKIWKKDDDIVCEVVPK